VTSVSRSDHDDEAPEGTGTGVSAERGPFVDGAAPKAPRNGKTTKVTNMAEAGSAGAAKGTAKGAAKGTAKGAAKRTAKGAAAASASDDETQTQAPSKRTAASRAASSKAAAVRGEAAKAARTARTSAAATPATRSRAAAAASTKRQTQRVAAALTTETTTAERAGRKQGEATTTGTGSASAAEVDETTRERPAQPARTAATVAAATIADDAVAGPGEAGPTATVATPAAETSAAPEAPVIDEPAAEEVIADAVPGAAADTAVATGSPVDAPVVPDAPATGAVAASIAVSAAAAAASDVDQAVVVIPAPAPRKPPARKKRTLRVARPAPAPDAPRVLAINGLVKRFGDNTAVDGISLDVRAGSFYGIVGPNGAGKTTTLSMVTGLLRPDAGTVRINDIDAWADPRAAKRATGALPDRLRLFDRLTGAQLLYYAGALRGLDNRTVRERSTELIAAFGLEDAVDRLVADYSAGMTKKIALACAMIHAPRLLVLDEPFESVDPVSAANLTDILERFVGGGGTVLLSSHGMDLIERVCDSAAIIIGGRVLASGTLDEVRVGQTLEDRFVELAGGRKAAEGMEWLHSFSD
jgi:ABC-type multidrug transport system ATPase subunit